MTKRRVMRDEAIESADLFMSNVDTILEKYHIRDDLTAEDCLEAIATELHSGVWDTVEKAHNEIQGWDA
jgi:hypothetical protein